MEPLNNYRKNIVTSQCGEDGIIQEIFLRLGIEKGQCVEFGASDGVTLSNTCQLWREKGWMAVLIEADSHRAALLRENVKKYSNVHVLQTFVRHEGRDSLDNILKPFKLDRHFDVLSIDVDGNDYYIWQHFIHYEPKVVIIEHNASIPPHIDFVDKPDRHMGFGASAKALVRLGKSKNYELAACTQGNIIFVHRAYYEKLGLFSNELEKLYDYGNLSYVVSKQDGELFLSRYRPINYLFPGEKKGFRGPADESGLWPIFLLRKDGNTTGCVLLVLKIILKLKQWFFIMRK